MNENNPKFVATTILHQLGGNRFIAMTEAKNIAFDENSLFFKIGKNNKKINTVSIIYDYGKDLYKIKFQIITPKIFKTISEFEDVFFTDLKTIFEKETGLFLTL